MSNEKRIATLKQAIAKINKDQKGTTLTKEDVENGTEALVEYVEREERLNELGGELNILINPTSPDDYGC
jgi:hypothetical protein